MSTTQKLDFKSYIAPQQNVAGKFKDIVTEADKQGFQVQIPTGSKSPVHLSKTNNPQILLMDKEGLRLYLRISTNLDAALRGGERINIMDSPVYEVELTQLTQPRGGNPNGEVPKMLVIGMAAEQQNFTPLALKDITTAFATYTRPEPSKA